MLRTALFSISGGLLGLLLLVDCGSYSPPGGGNNCGNNCGSLPNGVGPGGHLVGGSCRGNFDCQSLCVANGNFPNGTCTLGCRSDVQCPNGTACIDTAGGICVTLCNWVGNCGQFGPGYQCDAAGRVTGPDAYVCRVP